MGGDCVKTSNRNGNEQLCSSEAVHHEIFRAPTLPFLICRCAATGSNRVFTQPRWRPCENALAEGRITAAVAGSEERGAEGQLGIAAISGRIPMIAIARLML